jgi:hypothetical protein
MRWFWSEWGRGNDVFAGICLAQWEPLGLLLIIDDG